VRAHLALMLSLSLGLVACGTEMIVHKVDEREANRIIEVLADNNITATKLMRDTGREVFFTISVPVKSRLDAIRILNQYELPRRSDRGYSEVFSEGGLIPTSSEERAKQMSALEGEIERQLKLIDGVLDVQVQIVVPEETALRTTQEQQPPTTASVTLKYLPGEGGAKPLSELQVRSVVAAGVEKLTPDNVVVLMTPVQSNFATARTANRAVEGRGTGLKRLSSKQLNMIFAAVLGLVLLLGLGLVFSQMRLRTVRTRLIRLQNEIAKARRRPPEVASGS